MALEQSKRAQLLTEQNNIIANTVIKIEDPAFPELFGLVDTNRSLRIGDFYIGEEFKIGGVIVSEYSRDWLMERGTTNNISQKVDTDKPGGGSSINVFTVNLVDKDNELTKIFSPGVRVPDVLGLKATAYWMPAKGAFPEDATPIFRGIISTINFGAGSVSLSIDSPEQLKRQDLLPKYNSNLTSAIDNATTTVPVVLVDGLIPSLGALTTYIKIDDEIMEVTAVNTNDFTVIRESLGTLANAHDIDGDIESFYRLTKDSPVDLALELIISGSGSFGNESGKRINQVTGANFIQNGILITDEFIQSNNGLVVGDLLSITGAINGVNNITDREIIEFVSIAEGTVIKVSGTDMITEGPGFSITFKSKYDVLNFGCAIEPFHVDVQRFEGIRNLVGLQQPDFDGYIRDTIQAREFIDSEILWPSGMFGLFRQGRISIGANLPPLSSQNTKYLNSETVKNPEKIKIRRSFKQQFYNATVYKFEQNVLDERFLAGRIIQSSDSTNRIKVGNKPLTIESIGIRNTDINRNKIDIMARRVLDRYQYGAETLEVEVNFKTGFPIEIGDSVVLEGGSLKLSDSNSGTRNFESRVMECVNKSMNLKTGAIKLNIIDSVYQTDGRYGVISPASKLGTGSTTSVINLKQSYATPDGVSESLKWQDYIGQRIQVRSPNFAFSEVVNILSIDGSNPNKLDIQPALSIAPLEDYIIEPPNYDDSASRIDSFYKSQHVFPQKEISVSSGISTTQFNVTVPDSAYIVEGDNIIMHSADYFDEIEVTVLSNDAGLITVNDMGFTPDSTYGIIPTKFLDDNFIYRAF